jgi:hypothetical protein
MGLSRMPQLGVTASVRHNLSAAKTIGSCLSAFIDQRCIDENAQV